MRRHVSMREQDLDPKCEDVSPQSLLYSVDCHVRSCRNKQSSPVLAVVPILFMFFGTSQEELLKALQP